MVRTGAILVIAALIAAVVRVVLYPRFSNTTATIATALLLYVTLEYVLANHENVKLFRGQLEHQRKTVLDFGLTMGRLQAEIWVANLGLATFIVKQITVRVPAEEKERIIEIPTQLLVAAGRIETVALLANILQTQMHVVDIDIALRYTGLDGAEQTRPKGFNLIIDGQIRKVREGLRGIWPVSCGKCGKWYGKFMRPDGLANLDEARAREKIIEAQIAKTCPNHDSEWVMEDAPTERDVSN